MAVMPKSFSQIMNDMVGTILNGTSLEDLNGGSVFNAMMSASDASQRLKLTLFLSKLDGRFRKHINPCAELELAEKYFGRI